MVHRENYKKSHSYSSPERLIEATIDLWEERGNADVSARLVGQHAGLPVSSIYHHFGSMEHLSVVAQDAARTRAERWCDRRLNEFTTAALSPDAFPPLVAALIDDLTQDERGLAFAWRECQIMAARDPGYLPSLRAWQKLWTSFWREVCARCGLGQFGEATSIFFYGESLLHLMHWRRSVDRACLDETCRHWGEWLRGRLAVEGPWRRAARREANAAMPELATLSGIAGRIAAAAADTVEELGMRGLTHRAVAAHAGLTLGVVSYNFKTSADLARGAFETIYRRVAPMTADQQMAVPKPKEAFEGMVGYDILSPRLTAMDEVMLTVARDPDLVSFISQIRYLRGRTSGGQLQGLIGDHRLVSPADAALFSSFASGQRHACVALPEAEVGPFRRRTLTDLLSMLGVTAP